MNPIKYLIEEKQLRKFASSMKDLIHSIHPDAVFKIKHKRLGSGKVELSIDTKDDRAAACFVLLQEAMKLDEESIKNQFD